VEADLGKTSSLGDGGGTQKPAPKAERPSPAAVRRPPTDAERAAADKEDAELMRRFQKGDARAFEGLLARHRVPVYNFCLRMLGERTVAEDAMQEVFLRIVRAAKEWERQAKFTTWLYTIARNHCIDALRKASYRKTASLDQPLKGEDGEDGVALGERVADDESISPDRGADSLRLRQTLARAIAALPEEQREVFVMREHAGMPFKEIAAVVGVPENTVKSRMRYALEHLREALAKAGITREEP
jgi:RNA polymerase sigma-70 factor (ECF subfamily)